MNILFATPGIGEDFDSVTTRVNSMNTRLGYEAILVNAVQKIPTPVNSMHIRFWWNPRGFGTSVHYYDLIRFISSADSVVASVRIYGNTIQMFNGPSSAGLKIYDSANQDPPYVLTGGDTQWYQVEVRVEVSEMAVQVWLWLDQEFKGAVTIPGGPNLYGLQSFRLQSGYDETSYTGYMSQIVVAETEFNAPALGDLRVDYLPVKSQLVGGQLKSVQFVGNRPEALSTSYWTTTYANASTVMNDVVTAPGIIKEIMIAAYAAGGTVYVAPAIQEAENTFHFDTTRMVGPFTLTSKGVHKFVAGRDFPDGLALYPGEYIGYRCSTNGVSQVSYDSASYEGGNAGHWRGAADLTVPGTSAALTFYSNYYIGMRVSFLVSDATQAIKAVDDMKTPTLDDYAFGDDPDQVTDWTVDPIPSWIGNIEGVVAIARILKQGSPAATRLGLRLRSGAVTQETIFTPPETTSKTVIAGSSVDPATGLPWTPQALSNLRIGAATRA